MKTKRRKICRWLYKKQWCSFVIGHAQEQSLCQQLNELKSLFKSYVDEVSAQLNMR